MPISRDWATPLTIGAFILMACTGILMFFHLDTGLNKEVHEWLGWAMVTGVAFHVAVNWGPFKRYLGKPASLAIIGVFVAVLAGSFFIKEDEKEGNPAKRTTQAVLSAPISAIAPLAHQSPSQLVATLQQAGFTVQSPDQTLQAVTGPEREQQFKALGAIFH